MRNLLVAAVMMVGCGGVASLQAPPGDLGIGYSTGAALHSSCAVDDDCRAAEMYGTSIAAICEGNVCRGGYGYPCRAGTDCAHDGVCVESGPAVPRCCALIRTTGSFLCP